MKEVVYRPFINGDESRIVDLFMQAGPHLRTVGFWNWFNQSNPFGKSIIEVAESEGQIVGHYAVMPVDLQVKGVSSRAGFAAQAMIHTAYRNLGHILDITERVWKRCQEAGIEFVYAFPNDNIWKVNLSLMGWEAIGDFKSWQLSLKDMEAALASPARDVKITRVSNFDERINGLWADSPIAESGKIIVVRNAKFLNWRIFQHPFHHYQVFQAEREGQIVGYLVLKLYRKESVSYGHLIDLLTLKPDSEPITRALLAEACLFFRWAEVDTVSCWMCLGNPYMDTLLSLGFASTGFNTHFGYKFIAENRIRPSLSLENWYLTMTDSDAF